MLYIPGKKNSFIAYRRMKKSNRPLLHTTSQEKERKEEEIPAKDTKN
jgi:hypothetical protein